MSLKAIEGAVVGALIFLQGLMPAASSLAQTNLATSTPTTTPRTLPQTSARSTQSSGNDSSLLIGLGVGAGVVGGAALVGGFVQSLRSFGGHVINPAIPCLSPLGPSLFVTILQPPPKLPTVLPLIWTPLSITRSFGPPRTPLQKVLGTFDVPFVCFTYAVVPVPLPGFRITEIGTSIF